MHELLRREITGRTAIASVTERSDGDVHPERVCAATLRRRQVELTGVPWVMVDEVHGTDVVHVDRLGSRWSPLAGVGDVLLAERSDVPIAVWAADCAPVALFGANGTSRVVAHAGWRGLAGGVLDVAVDALESTGTTVAAAVLGPCIHGCCNEFGLDDLDRVAGGVGAERGDVTSTTAWGTNGLDVPAAVAAGLARRGVALDHTGACTGCDRRFRSHRSRFEPERHALVAWFEESS
jgi:copper oxidase (laccase) domain-containing protein